MEGPHQDILGAQAGCFFPGAGVVRVAKYNDREIGTKPVQPG